MRGGEGDILSRLSRRVALILIHGMSAKPPEPAWLDLWRLCLSRSIAVEHPELAARVDDDPDLLVSAYWADIIPDHLPHPAAEVRAVREAVDALLAFRREHGEAMHVPAGGWGPELVSRFGMEAVSALSESLSVRKERTETALWELKRYHGNAAVMDSIRRPLETRLREAWEAGREVVVLSHSLGTVVAYDALWRFTHRPDPEFREYRRRVVRLWVTMGSPLGDAEIGEVMLAGRWLRERNAPLKARRLRAWPGNVRAWHNYSALGDMVCHDLDMGPLFHEPMARDLGQYRKGDLRDYRRLLNPFRDVNGTPNPHKSYGYLVQPRLARRLAETLARIDA